MTTAEAAVLRYRAEVAPLRGNPTVDALLAHRSVRAFLPDALPPGTIETIVAAAQSAATSSNLQPWSVVAVEDADLRARLAELAGGQRHIVEAPLFLVWLVDFDRLTRLGKVAGVPVDAPDYVETFLLGAVDASLAAQNAVVAIESLALGAVYIGGIRNHPDTVAAELDLPPRVFALVGLAVGVPDPARPAAVKPRLPQAAVLHRERYRRSDDATATIYDDQLRAFQVEQGLPSRGWTEVAVARVRGPGSMAGRHVLRDVLARRGFPLR